MLSTQQVKPVYSRFKICSHYISQGRPFEIPNLFHIATSKSLVLFLSGIHFLKSVWYSVMDKGICHPKPNHAFSNHVTIKKNVPVSDPACSFKPQEKNKWLCHVGFVHLDISNPFRSFLQSSTQSQGFPGSALTFHQWSIHLKIQKGEKGIH